MGLFTTLGIVLMTIAALSLVGLAIDIAFRYGGEGTLIALGLSAGATVPAWVALHMHGVNTGLIAQCASIYIAIILAILGVFGIMLLIRRQREGMMCLGIALVVGGALYAIAPGYIAAHKAVSSKAAATTQDA